MRITTLCLTLVLLLTRHAHAQRIELKDMLFPDKELGEKFKRIHAAAEKMAGPKWERMPYQSRGEYMGRGVYYGEWANFREDDLNGPFNYHGPKEVGYVQYGAFFFRDEKDPDHLRKIIGLTLHTRWKPADTGWTAYITYRTYNGKPDPATTAKDEYFNLRWHYHPLPTDKTVPAGMELNLHGHAWYATAFRSGDTLYLVGIPTKATVIEPRIPDKEVMRILASPESLRDQLLADHESLLKTTREVMKAGDSFYSARVERPAVPGKQPGAPELSSRPLTDADREKLIKQAEQEIGAKITSIKTHYKDLFAAARKAFPIGEVLIEAKGR